MVNDGFFSHDDPRSEICSEKHVHLASDCPAHLTSARSPTERGWTQQGRPPWHGDWFFAAPLVVDGRQLGTGCTADASAARWRYATTRPENRYRYTFTILCLASPCKWPLLFLFPSYRSRLQRKMLCISQTFEWRFCLQSTYEHLFKKKGIFKNESFCKN